MDQAIKVAKFVALSSLAFLLIILSVAVDDARNTLKAIEADIRGVTDKAATELITLNASTSAVSEQTVATLKSAAATATQANTTIAKLNPAVEQLTADLKEGHSLIYDARASITEVNRTTLAERKVFEESIPDMLAGVNKDVFDAGDTITAAKTLIADPNLKRLIAESAEGLATGNHMLATADQVETKATKSYLHPSTNPAARTWEAVKPFLVPAAQVSAAIALH
jgi:hypothetical protein